MARDNAPRAPKAMPLGKAPPRPERQKREARLEKQVAFHLGISAESRAAALLIAKGFRILARRFKSPAGEIDIVARRRQLLVFVEVKARADLDAAAAAVTPRQRQRIAAAVTPRQRQRIAAAAEAWLAVNGADGFRDMRFDAILVAPGKLPRHIPAAFET